MTTMPRKGPQDGRIATQEVGVQSADGEALTQPQGPNRASKGTRGAISELTACTWFLDQGFSVFRSESPHCPFDLVIYRDGELQRVEVKTATYPTGPNSAPTFPMPTNLEWDLLCVVVDGECQIYQPEHPRELRATFRERNGRAPLRWSYSTLCDEDGCEDTIFRKGYCYMHKGGRSH